MKTLSAARPKAGHTDIDSGSILTWTDARTGRQEIRYAASADGAWAYERIEDAGTTWIVTERATGRQLDFEPNLLLARRGTHDGWTRSEISRQHLAHTA